MKYIYSFFVVLGLLLSYGCTDFLEEMDKSNFTRETYFKTAEHAQSIVNAIYSDLQFTSENDFGGNPYFMTDFQTGLAGTRVGQNVNINSIRMLANSSDNNYSKSWWNFSYRAIGNANMAIAKIPEIEMDEDAKKKLLGEAYFLRAYNYFNLVRIFGRVPLVLNPVDASSPELYPIQETIENIYQSIVSDLDAAENSGLAWVRKDGRVNMAAVKALMSSVYLTMAGSPLGAGNQYYALAAGKAKEVIDHGDYYLFPSYDDLHKIENENEGEHIFMAQYQSGIKDNPLQLLYLPNTKDISAYTTEPGTIYALDAFIDAYESTDKRIENKALYYYEYTSNKNRDEIVDLGAYYIYKFFDTDAHLNTAKSSLNHPIIRYAEVLLIFAEAQNEADGGPSQEAYDALNEIRERAGLAPSSALSQDEFREEVWKQKYFELAFENKVWFDMARTLKVLDLTSGAFNDYIGHEFVYGPVLSDKELLFPIPTGEIKNNKNLDQNSGY